MTARTIEHPETGTRRIEIRCDRCECLAPPAEAILAAHGLNRMGWTCSGGSHLCHDCAGEMGR